MNLKQINELKKFIEEDLEEIRNEALNERPICLRFGQAVFNSCYKKFPISTSTLSGTNYDCFYNDNNVDIFLNELKNTLLEKLID